MMALKRCITYITRLPVFSIYRISFLSLRTLYTNWQGTTGNRVACVLCIFFLGEERAIYIIYAAFVFIACSVRCGEGGKKEEKEKERIDL